MTIREAKHKYIRLLTAMTVVLGLGLGVAMHYWAPEHYPAIYPCIPLFFYLYGMAFVSVYALFPEKGLVIHLGGKVVKLVLGLLFLVLYALLIKVQMKAFTILFLFYYLVYLIVESGFFLNYEKTMKNQKEQ